jgi:hypothetical protein
VQNRRSCYFLLFIILVFLPASCKENNTGTEQKQQPQTTPTKKLQPTMPTSTEQSQQATSTPYKEIQQGGLPQLFKEAAEPANSAPSASHVIRSRYVHINTDLLLDANNKVLEMAPGTQLDINLFPGVNYIGVLERVEQNGPDSYSWVGSLQDIEYSRMYIIFTEGVFLAHFASPSGVYEVRQIENNLYQVVEIDQTKLPQE